MPPLPFARTGVIISENHIINIVSHVFSPHNYFSIQSLYASALKNMTTIKKLIQSYADDFGSVKKSGNGNRASESARDNHTVASALENAVNIVGEKRAVCAEQSADSGQTHDAAVGVTAENEVNGQVGILRNPVIAVAEENPEGIGIFRRHCLRKLIGMQHFRPAVGVLNAAENNFIAAPFKAEIFVVQVSDIVPFENFAQGGYLTRSKIVVAAYKVDGAYILQLVSQRIDRLQVACIAYEIARQHDDVRRKQADLFGEPSVKFLSVQVGKLDYSEALETLGNFVAAYAVFGCFEIRAAVTDNEQRRKNEQYNKGQNNYPAVFFSFQFEPQLRLV